MTSARCWLLTIARIALRAPLLLTLIAAVPVTVAATENPEIAKRRAAERKSFSDAEIIEGFFKITLSAEFQSGRVDRIRKYDRPVRVYVDNRGKPDRRRQVAATISDIKAHVQHLDIALTTNRQDANVLVTLVNDRHLGRTLRSVYGPDQAKRIQRSLDPQCLASFRKDNDYRIIRSDVILVTDASDFIFHDCAYEELLQALGPINDDSSVPWTMFNDDVSLGFFGLYDQYLLNILYHPRIRPGMSRDEVTAVLPEVLAEVRSFVAEVNKLPQ